MPSPPTAAESTSPTSRRSGPQRPLWAGRPGDALQETRRALALFKAPDLTIFSGRLLAAGMRACADLAGQARARRDQPAAADAADAADGLATWVEQMAGAPFADHRYVATIPAWHATWDAERTRVAGPSDPGAWDGAAKAWQDLGCPHRAGYAWWRQAQAQLDAGQPAAAAAAALRAAAAAADGHAPLLAQVRALAERARIPLQPAAAADRRPAAGPAADPLRADRPGAGGAAAAGRRAHQRSDRRRAVHQPSTASVHVSNILRKLGVSGRVQAAALAERAGLLATPATLTQRFRRDRTPAVGRPAKGAPRISKRPLPPRYGGRLMCHPGPYRECGSKLATLRGWPLVTTPNAATRRPAGPLGDRPDEHLTTRSERL